MNFRIRDHAIYVHRDHYIHVVVRQIQQKTIYLSAFSSDRVYSCGFQDLLPFTLELGENLQNAKTRKFCQQIRDGKILRTAGHDYLFQNNVLTDVKTNTQQQDLQDRQICLEVSPFIYNSSYPRTITIRSQDKEFYFDKFGNFGVQNTVCNNRTQLAVNQQQAQCLLTAHLAIQQEEQLATLRSVLPDELIFYYELGKARHCTYQPIATLFDGFFHYIENVFTQQEINVVSQLQQVVMDSFDYSDLDTGDFLYFCIHKNAAEIPFAQRCMLVVIVNWLVQNQKQFYTVN